MPPSRKRAASPRIRPARSRAVDPNDEHVIDGRFSAELNDRWDRECVVRPPREGEREEIERRWANQLKERRETQPGLQPVEDAPHCDDVFESVFDVMLAEQERRLKEAQEAQLCRSRIDYSTDLLRNTRRCKGDEKIDLIREYWGLMCKPPPNGGQKLTRSVHQRQFHQAFLQAVLPHIYGSEWPDHYERVLKEFGIPCIRPEVMVCTPRRLGKSIAIAMFNCGLLLACPGIRIATFSTGSRASGALMGEIVKLLQLIPGGRERVLKRNQEQLFLAATATGVTAGSARARALGDGPDVSKLYSFPGSTTGTWNKCTRFCMRERDTTGESGQNKGT